MSPRPRTVSDEAILDATRRLMGKLGPTRFTLAAVAKAVGLAPATLVQRFGSKRKLLLALARAGGEDPNAGLLDRLHATVDSPLECLREFLACFAGMAPTPAELANHLAFFQVDLTDPTFHRITLELSRRNEAAAADLVRAAVAAGELEVEDEAGLARALLATAAGSLLNWGIFREGKARDWLLRDCDVLLAPLRRERPRLDSGAPGSRRASARKA